MDYLAIGLSVLSIVLSVVIIVKLSKTNSESGVTAAAINEQLEKMRKELAAELRESRQEQGQAIQGNIRSLAEVLASAQKQSVEMQDKRLSELNTQLTQRQDTLQKTVAEQLRIIDDRFKTQAYHSEQKLENIRSTVESKMTFMQQESNKRLDEMRATVDEKLQKTLEERISQSFRVVSERLEQVYKGLGEMQNLAIGVGDLKKVLSNVKTRGILGEIQLGSILEQILAPEQYDINVATKRSSSNVVEYAVRLPGDGEGGIVYLPIDAKFPGDAYAQLMDAYETGDQAAVEAAGTALERRIKSSAKDIRDKYIDPPGTTDFGIMFLPFEGLYAEVVRRGMVEALQRDYKINIAGPTTMAALLNSLQMGFRTLAIQKRSSEVWNVLGAVKTEFDKFGNVLAATQQRLEQANNELDKLVGVRTRQIQRRLRSVTSLPEESTALLLETAESEPDED